MSNKSLPSRATATVTINVGIMSFGAKLHSLTWDGPSKRETSLACPHCAAEGVVTSGTQAFLCAEGHGAFTKATAASAIKTPEGKRLVGWNSEVADAGGLTDAELAEMKVLNVKVVPAGDVALHTVPSGDMWMVTPVNGTDAIAASFAAALNEASDLALVGEVHFARGTRLVQLDRWGDHLVMRQLVRPEAVRHVANVLPAPKAQNVDLMVEMLWKLYDADGFGEDAYPDVAARRKAAWIDEHAVADRALEPLGEKAAASAAAVSASDDAVTEALMAFLGKQAAPKAAPKTPKTPVRARKATTSRKKVAA